MVIGHLNILSPDCISGMGASHHSFPKILSIRSNEISVSSASLIADLAALSLIVSFSILVVWTTYISSDNPFI